MESHTAVVAQEVGAALALGVLDHLPADTARHHTTRHDDTCREPLRVHIPLAEMMVSPVVSIVREPSACSFITLPPSLTPDWAVEGDFPAGSGGTQRTVPPLLIPLRPCVILSMVPVPEGDARRREMHVGWLAGSFKRGRRASVHESFPSNHSSGKAR